MPDPNDIVFAAAAFAARAHRNQTRKDGQTPYFSHPVRVCLVVRHVFGFDDPRMLATALLHDTIEDTNTTEEELREVFGDRVASIVLEVTDDKALPKAQRKQLQIEHASRISAEAKLVKLADKIANVTDILHSPPADWSPDRKAEYFVWAGLVVEGLRGVNAPLESMFDALTSAGK